MQVSTTPGHESAQTPHFPLTYLPSSSKSVGHHNPTAQLLGFAHPSYSVLSSSYFQGNTHGAFGTPWPGLVMQVPASGKVVLITPGGGVSVNRPTAVTGVRPPTVFSLEQLKKVQS